MAETAAILTADSLVEIVSITKDDEGNPVTNNIPIRVTLGDLTAYIIGQIPPPSP